jgi:hypothetical protein
MSEQIQNEERNLSDVASDAVSRTVTEDTIPTVSHDNKQPSVFMHDAYYQRL